jgi:hypothetical protein
LKSCNDDFIVNAENYPVDYRQFALVGAGYGQAGGWQFDKIGDWQFRGILESHEDKT